MRENVTLTAVGGTKVGNELIFVALDLNLIYKVNLDSKKTFIIGSVPEESFLQRAVCSAIAYSNDRLIFAPMTAEKIWIYHFKTNEWHGIELRSYSEARIPSKFVQIVVYKEKVFMVGALYPAIVCLDLNDETVTYLEEPYIKLREKHELTKDVYFRSDYVLKDDVLYMASCVSNHVLMIHLETMECTLIEVGSAENRYSGIAYDYNAFWLVPRINTSIVKWDGECSVQEYMLPESVNECPAYLGVVCYKDKIIFPSISSAKTLILNSENLKDYKYDNSKYMFVKMLDDGEILSGSKDGTICVLKTDGSRQYYKAIVASNDLKKERMEWERYIEKNIALESGVFGMDDLCDCLIKKESSYNDLHYSNYGKEIWDSLNR